MCSWRSGRRKYSTCSDSAAPRSTLPVPTRLTPSPRGAPVDRRAPVERLRSSSWTLWQAAGSAVGSASLKRVVRGRGTATMRPRSPRYVPPASPDHATAPGCAVAWLLSTISEHDAGRGAVQLLATFGGHDASRTDPSCRRWATPCQVTPSRWGRAADRRSIGPDGRATEGNRRVVPRLFTHRRKAPTKPDQAPRTRVAARRRRRPSPTLAAPPVAGIGLAFSALPR